MASNRRDFRGFAQAPRIPKALLALEPRVGLSFTNARKHPRLARQTPKAPKPKEDWSIKARLIAQLGPRGYGHLLEQLRAVTVEPPKPKRRRPRRRKEVVAA